MVGQVVLNQAGDDEDGGEEVNEIVSNASGEDAEAFQLMGMAGAFLEPAALGYVAKVDAEAIVGWGDALFPIRGAALDGIFEGDLALIIHPTAVTGPHVGVGGMRQHIPQ